MRLSRRLAFLSIAGVLAVGCGEENPLSPENGSIVIEPIPIESVDVTVGAARPARAIARVKGVLGSGCDFLYSLEQRREGSTVTVEIRRSGDREGICTAILKQFEQEIALPGTFARGEYTLRVNSVTKTFQVN
jgi:hypothetical protein